MASSASDPSLAEELSVELRVELEDFCLGIEEILQDTKIDSGQVVIQLLCIQEAIQQIHHMRDVLDPRDHNAAIRRLVPLRGQLELREHQLSTPAQQQVWFQGQRGAWTVALDHDLLIELAELRFTDSEMAVMLGCSRRTVQRRRAELGIAKRAQTEVNHEEICNMVMEIRRRGTGQEGERAMIGALRAAGIAVSRARLRLAVRATDPFGQLLVRSQPIQRRTYSVPFVNSLWHMDGHHKLIRWRLVIHAAIDGKSRLLTFIQASSNNLAQTVGRVFIEGTEAFGWPSRVRADYGGENLQVKRLMEEKRGQGRGSFIQGSSVHNQRIERLWVDMQRWATTKYRRLFETLEHQEYLNVDDPVHLWTLHLVFLPQLNAALKAFQQQWNNHPMSTPGLQNKSPRKLFIQGRLEAERAGWAIMTGNAENVGPAAMLRDFAEFGTGLGEDDVAREPRIDDPHVDIAALDGQIPAVLLRPEVQLALRRRLPCPWPPPEDLGVAAFQQALLMVDLILRSGYTGNVDA